VVQRPDALDAFHGISTTGVRRGERWLRDAAARGGGDGRAAAREPQLECVVTLRSDDFFSPAAALEEELEEELVVEGGGRVEEGEGRDEDGDATRAAKDGGLGGLGAPRAAARAATVRRRLLRPHLLIGCCVADLFEVCACSSNRMVWRVRIWCAFRPARVTMRRPP